MRRFLLTILITATSFLCADAQIIDGRTNDITLFHAYQPALILLESGKANRQREANVFLKNGALIYKSQGKVMQANMDVVKAVLFGETRFIKVAGKLAEVVDSCGENALVLVRQINIDGLNMEILNNSTITSVDITGSEYIGITRTDVSPDQLAYPVDDIYYFMINGKPVLAHERDARRAAGRKRQEAYEKVINDRHFKWTQRESLMEVLKVLSSDTSM